MTPQEKLQAEAEQLYPDFPNKLDHNGFPYRDYTVEEVRNFQRAAHVACAEKYTAIIGEKDKEIERLRRFVFDVRDWPVPMDYRGIAKMQEAAFDLLNTKNPTP